ncbi:ABC transporter transmembrane domain-containing protein [Nonomuraea sp. NPDC049725]|uniref:ABC transporter transmembrane domain-containing protein n=1 Tax=Nonomuraea sp. NPDC049725 TaxID=3154508 RepID=UPI0034423698
MQAADRLVLDTVRRGGPWPAILAVTAITGAAAELALPYLVGRTVDAFTAAAPQQTFWLALSAAVVAAVMLCESLGVWARGASAAHAAAGLRLRLLRHVLAAGLPVTRRYPGGELVTRTGLNTEEVGRAPEAVTGALTPLVPTVGALVALVLIDPRLAAALAAGVVAILLVLRAFLRTTTAVAGGYQEVQGEIAARLVDALGGARTITAAGTADREARRVLGPLPRLRARGLGLWRANATAGVQAGLVVPVVEIAVLAAGGLLLAAGDLTIGELYAAARYAVLGAALSGALGYLGGLARARSAAARVAELFTLPTPHYGTHPLPPYPPKPSGTAGGAASGRTPGTLEFRSVTAAGLAVPELVIPGGTVTAVVGRSGSGKSLLAALAARLADPSGGAVLLDGVPLTELPRRTLRRAIGYAVERPVLTGDTIADALTPYPGPSGDDLPEHVAEAARAACADSFVRRLPDGYDTPLADAPMSGGERQRLGLARAFARGERLLVLDDATSSLDTVTERQVARALTEDPRGRTRLIVAHRLATAARADQVIWLDNGAVRATGPHRDLWQDPAYRAIFQSTPHATDTAASGKHHPPPPPRAGTPSAPAPRRDGHLPGGAPVTGEDRAAPAPRAGEGRAGGPPAPAPRRDGHLAGGPAASGEGRAAPAPRRDGHLAGGAPSSGEDRAAPAPRQGQGGLAPRQSEGFGGGR